MLAAAIIGRALLHYYDPLLDKETQDKAWKNSCQDIA